MSIKILNIEWVTRNFASIGIVLIENEIGEQSARMGISPVRFDAEPTEADDARFIADYGRKLTFPQAKGFFPQIEESKYKKS